MANFTWNTLKSERLKWTRGVSFEEVVQFRLLRIDHHPSRQDQKIMFFEGKGYVWVVPFIEKGNERFLKTLYPSRKYTKLFRKGPI